MSILVISNLESNEKHQNHPNNASPIKVLQTQDADSYLTTSLKVCSKKITHPAMKLFCFVKVHRYSFSWPDKIMTIKLMPNLKNKHLVYYIEFFAFNEMSENILKNV